MVKNGHGIKIGQGWQYAVFDYGDKVKKVPHSREDIRQILLLREVQYEDDSLEVLVDRILEYRDESVAGLLKMEIDRSLLGDPVFLENGSFFQNKVTTLRDKIDELEGDTEGCRWMQLPNSEKAEGFLKYLDRRTISFELKPNEDDYLEGEYDYRGVAVGSVNVSIRGVNGTTPSQ